MAASKPCPARSVLYLWRYLSVTLLVVASMLPACSEQSPPAFSDAGAKCAKWSTSIEREVDLLIVYDTSPAMALGQKNLQGCFPREIEALRSAELDNMLPNLRIGIISADLGMGSYTSSLCNDRGGDQGKLQHKAQVSGCTPPTNPWISFSYDPETKKAVTNIPGFFSTDGSQGVLAVKNAYACISSLGAGGCEFSQPLEAARRALDPQQKINPGFLRNDPPGSGHCVKKSSQTCKTADKDACGADDSCVRQNAKLAILFITAQDDCSASNPQLFDTNNQGLNDPLGPLSTFRCFEFGVTCECSGQPCTRTFSGQRKNCTPKSKNSTYLHRVEDYISFFQNLKLDDHGQPDPSKLIIATISGPFTGTVITEVLAHKPTVKPSCHMGNYTAQPAVRLKALAHALTRKLSSAEVAAIKAKTKNIPHWIDKDGAYQEENFTTICTNNYAPAFELLGERMVDDHVSRCVEWK